MKNRIDISKGRYWDRAWSLVDGCTPCSPGCDHCWSAAMAQRFGGKGRLVDEEGNPHIVENRRFTGEIITRPDRLDIPLRTRKPTVFSVWNDFHHPSVTDDFKVTAYHVMVLSERHTFLILTKRPQIMADFLSPANCFKEPSFPNIWNGLTVCNQAEADEKIPIFLQVPGKKFLSIEPMLSEIDILQWLGDYHSSLHGGFDTGIDAVILGGETGPGARPTHPDWVRSVRDQCAEAGVPFFLKSWGKWGLNWMNDDNGKIEGSEWMDNGIKNTGRLLDGRTHNDLPWHKGD